MAVYQISKIQVRRGKKGTGTGLPQLASGELAWAIDTQELYIGNGALSEGAPEIGNTKIISETDNIFGIFLYQYKENDLDSYNNSIVQTGPADDAPIVQQINHVLDRTVWAENFDVQNSEVTVNNIALQRAINELYLKKNYKSDRIDSSYGRLDTEFRVELRFTPGVYRITETIYLPSFVSIVGAGIDKTIFQYDGFGSAFEFINDEASDHVSDVTGQFVSYNGTTWETFVDNTLESSAQPSDARLRDFTLYLSGVDATASPSPVVSSQTGFKVNSLSSSTFENIEIIGNWSNGSTISPVGIELLGSDTSVTNMCTDLTFSNVRFKGLETAFTSIHAVNNITFKNCMFNGSTIGTSYSAAGVINTNTYREINNAIVLGNEAHDYDSFYGPRNITISDCTFKTVTSRGIHAPAARNVKSINNTFTDVGTDGANPTMSAIYFYFDSNSSVNDTFNRYDNLSGTSTGSVFISEVSGISYRQVSSTKEVLVDGASGHVLRLPALGTTAHTVNYIYQSGTHMRSGELKIAVDVANTLIQLTDEYNCTTTTTETLVDAVDAGNVLSQQYDSVEDLNLTAAVALNANATDYEVLVSYANATGETDGVLTLTYNSLINSNT